MPARFHFSAGSTALLAAEAQRAIYASPAWLRLYPYLPTLETQFLKGPAASELKGGDRLRKQLAGLGRLIAAPAGGGEDAAADVLLVGECDRPCDILMMEKLLAGIVDSGRSAIYLARSGSTEHAAISGLMQRRGMGKFITLLDPFADRSPVQRLRRKVSETACAYRDYAALCSALAPGFGLKLGSLAWVREVARKKVAWDLIAPSLHSATVILRNHWLPFSAAVAASYVGSRKVVTFQHGVVSSPTCFVPVLASCTVCFGESSCRLLGSLDADFAAATGRTIFCRKFVPAGSLVDELTLLPPNRAAGSVLIIDQANEWAREYYGIGPGVQALAELVEELARRSGIIGKVVVRPHPSNTGAKWWLELRDRYPGRVEISAQGSTLASDLESASVVLGLFSGALVTAAACGIPTLFLWNPGWYFTPDLAPFVPHAFVSPAAAVGRVETLVSDGAEYDAVRARGREAAGAYYHQNKTCTFDADFVNMLLGNDLA